MHHSIARYILGIIIVVIFAMAGIIAAFEIDEAQSKAFNSANTVSYGASKALAMRYTGYEKDDFYNDQELYSAITADMKQLISDFDIIFIYIFVPSEDNSGLTYFQVEGQEGTEDTLQEVRNKPKRKNDVLSEEVLRVANGQSAREDVEIDNHFGHVLSTYIPIYDDDNQVIGVVGSDVSVSGIRDQLLLGLPNRMFIILLVGIVGVVALFLIIRRRVITPIRAIKDAMDAFGKNGNYNTPKLKLGNRDELALISDAFNNMADQTCENINRIKQFQDIQSKQAYELKTASEIQKGFIPCGRFENDVVQINGCMTPAKDVGGDFYDYFEYNGKMVACIADVSGKGLSGAIFMAGAISLIRGFVKQGLSPHEVLSAVNRELELNNPNLMFVTVFLCYVDVKNGSIEYSNAGHNEPYVLIDGKFKKLAQASSMPLGVFGGETYESASELFPLGATLFLYTDGVNEAVNAKGEFFGYCRLEEILQQSFGGSVVNDVSSGLNGFVGSFEQSDDITMLALTSRAQTLELPAQAPAFDQLKAWVLQDANIPEGIRKQMCLAAEELFINIASYAYENAGGKVKVRKQVCGQSCLLQFSDNGRAFDPSQNIVNINDYDPFAQVGGLGRFVTKSITDAWLYENFCGLNVSLLIKNQEA